MQQEQLWHDSLSDAVRSLVEALSDPETGRAGVKATAARMWPAMNPITAQQKLLHSLDPDRPEKLSLDELDTLIAWGREQGVHVVPGYLEQRHGYELTVRSVEDQRDQLQREFIAAQRGMKALLKRMEALS